VAPPSDTLIQAVMDVAGHYPFYLQIAAELLFDSLSQQQQPDRHAFDEAFTQRAERHLSGLWRNLSHDEQACIRLLCGAGAVVVNPERVTKQLMTIGVAEGGPSQPRVFSSVFGRLVADDSIAAGAEPRRARPRPAPDTPAAEEPAAQGPVAHGISPLFAYLIGGGVCALLALVIALFLPPAAFLIFFIIFAALLTFVLVGADKLTGGQFVEFLNGLAGRLQR
jgi:hypothetical protein